MGAKLTRAQALALSILSRGRIAVTVWGGRPISGLPRQIRTRSTLDLLVSKGLASFSVRQFEHRYDITPAGRALIARKEGEAGGGDG